MRRLKVLSIGLAAFVGIAGAAHAQPDEIACFDWLCQNTSTDPWVSTCRFDVGCSLPDAGYVSYRWDWGDGTVSPDEVAEIVYHEYHEPFVTPRLTILIWRSPGESVSCKIRTYPLPVGPPGPDRCTSECALPVGHRDYCRDCGPCGSGEGDCDSNSECKSGLSCLHDVGTQYGFDELTDVCDN